MATLYEHILKYQDKTTPAIYYENKTISYVLLHKNIRKMISYLKSKGIKENDVVTVVLPNVPTTIYLLYALDAIGAKQNIIHPLTPFEGILQAMEDTSSKNLIVLETLYQEHTLEFEEASYNIFFVNPMYDNNLFMRKAFYFKYKGIKENDHMFKIDKFHKEEEYVGEINHDDKKDSIFLHSGGTTGNPKIIALSDQAFNNLSSKIDGIVPSSLEGKSMLAVLPHFHGFGLGMGIHSPLYKGATTAIMMKFNSNKIIKWINQNKINFIIGIPLLYTKLFENKKFLKCHYENLEYLFIGGDNCSTELIEKTNNFFKEKGIDCALLEGYGLTETVTVSNVNTKENQKVGSVGKPLEGIKIQIRDEELNLLKPNEVGEVFISGDTLMNGYFNNPKATQETKLVIDDEEWIRTGDLGYLDEDGFLFIKGRKKRLIKISGINVYPSEVENLVSRIEGVRHAALIYFEESKKMSLFVTIHKEQVDDQEQLIKEIDKNIKNKFTKYAWPKTIHIVEHFPRTKMGKIDYKEFKDLD